MTMYTNVFTDDAVNDSDTHKLDALLGARGMRILSVAGPVPARPFTPEMRLAAEVLRQAFADLEHEHVYMRDDAQAWFESEDTGHEHTYLAVCETLHLDPENLRRASKDPDRRRAINERLRKEWNEGGRKA